MGQQLLFDVGEEEETKVSKEVRQLVSDARRLLEEIAGVSEDYFLNTNWEQEQIEWAVEMLKDWEPRFWLDCLGWCLDSTDKYKRAIRHLSTLRKYERKFLLHLKHEASDVQYKIR